MDSNPTIFIADDDEWDRRLTKRALLEVWEDATILEAVDGEDALVQLCAMDEDHALTLIVMDFKMPKMGFLDLLRRLDRPALLRKTPIIVLSSSLPPADVDACLGAGVCAFVEKPTDCAIYHQVLVDACRRCRAQ